ncbi:MAG: DUF72 domain-containing protein [Cyclobacteriaceae bacterium]
MEFGKIITDDLSTVDFILPPDKDDTSRILTSQPKTIKPSVFVGCAKWGRKDWIGKIFPKGTREVDFLPLYAKHFNSIELNATFYKIPSFKQTQEWKKKVGKNFLFIPKISNSISHIHRLKDTSERMDRFLEGISGFGENLGPVFLMPHPGMGPKNIDRIEAFIQSLPKEIKLFVELRHPEWFESPSAFNEVFSMLERTHTGAVITDTAGKRDCVHMRLTTPEAFIRFVGNDLHPTDYTRVDSWIQRIKSWMDYGLQRVFFFMHQTEEVHSPEMARYAIQQLNKYCGTNIPDPIFVEQDKTLSNTNYIAPGITFRDWPSEL